MELNIDDNNKYNLDENDIKKINDTKLLIEEERKNYKLKKIENTLTDRDILDHKKKIHNLKSKIYRIRHKDRMKEYTKNYYETVIKKNEVVMTKIKENLK
jgi:hypothetical protein